MRSSRVRGYELGFAGALSLLLACDPAASAADGSGSTTGAGGAAPAEESASASYPAPPMNFSAVPVPSASSSAARLDTTPVRCEGEPPVLIRRPTLTDEQLRAALTDGTPIAGSASIGEPSRGSLFAGVQVSASESLERSGKHGFGTELTVRSIERAAREVARCHPGGPKVHVGDISAARGGWISPHRSHQAGVDADIGFYYRGGAAWYVAPTEDMLDVERTWSFIRALIEGGGVEVVFLDLRIQRMLYEEGKKTPPLGWKLDDVFDLGHKKDKLLRHEHGHATHLHVRFLDPWAKALGARVLQLDPTGGLRSGAKTAKPKPKAPPLKQPAPKPKQAAPKQAAPKPKQAAPKPKLAAPKPKPAVPKQGAPKPKQGVPKQGAPKPKPAPT